MSKALAIISAVIGGIPKLVELLDQGLDPADIKLGDFISTDALKVLEAAKADAQDFITNG
jgi:hypothetical protein